MNLSARVEAQKRDEVVVLDDMSKMTIGFWTFFLPSRVEAIAIRLDAIAIRLEAIASRIVDMHFARNCSPFAAQTDWTETLQASPLLP